MRGTNCFSFLFPLNEIQRSLQEIVTVSQTQKWSIADCLFAELIIVIEDANVITLDVMVECMANPGQAMRL